MPGIFGSLMETIGFSSAEENENEMIEVTEKETPKSQSTYSEEYHQPYARRSKVVKIDTTARLDVVILQPESFEDSQDVADAIKAKRPCVLNLENVAPEVERRIVDFVSGVIYAVDGSIQRVSKGIFLVAPYNVSITGDFKNNLRSSGAFSMFA